MQFVCTNKLPQMHYTPSACIYSSYQANLTEREWKHFYSAKNVYAMLWVLFIFCILCAAYILCATWLCAFESQNIFVYVNVVYGV